MDIESVAQEVDLSTDVYSDIMMWFYGGTLAKQFPVIIFFIAAIYFPCTALPLMVTKCVDWRLLL